MKVTAAMASPSINGLGEYPVPRARARVSILLALLIILTGLSFHATSQPIFCGTCHEMNDPYLQSWEDSIHAPEATCVSCHVGKGLKPLLQAKTTRSFHDLYAHFISGFETPIRQTHPIKDSICLECHEVSSNMLNTSLVQHDLHSNEGVPCIVCHAQTAHASADQAAALASDPVMCENCHEAHLNSPLIGGHSSIECGDCHVNGIYNEIESTCESCHNSPVDHIYEISTKCEACHTLQGWEQPVDNHKELPLTEKHSSLNCVECHPKNAYKETLNLCESCHNLPTEHFNTPNVDTSERCGDCHITKGWEPAEFDHSFYPLVDKHQQIECTECHIDGQYVDTPKQCESCHKKPNDHLDDFSLNCDDCHDVQSWKPARFEEHSFPLDHESQTTIRCDTCHPDDWETYSCYLCHEHERAKVEDEHREEGIPDFQDCFGCHPTGREHE